MTAIVWDFSDNIDATEVVSQYNEDCYGNTVTSDDWIKNNVLSELELLFHDFSVSDWDGYNAEPIKHETFISAKRLIRMLPTDIPLPEIGAEPDGSITFEWYRSPNYIVSMSLTSDIRIFFASLKGERTQRGSDVFYDKLPFFVHRLIRSLGV